MAEPAIATPGSNADSNTPGRAPAPKDKRCPYCDQAFTSSSLGRHLDLYIKEKNPKPADDIHNVEEIRKSRGGITRRQARTSSVRGSSSTPMSSKRSPEEPAPASPPHKMPRRSDVPGGRGRTKLNEGGWQATGVIRDLPIKSREGGPVRQSIESRFDAGTRGGDLVRGAPEQQRTDRDALYRGRAAELALREVLDSVHAASTRAGQASSALDFDPFCLAFPALVLRCLPTPATLFSTQPFPTASSWSLDPPGPAQFDALVHHLRTVYKNWAADVAAAAQSRKTSSSTASDPDTGMVNGFNHPSSVAEEEAERIIRHVSDAFDHYTSLSDKVKAETWRLELQRAYSRERQLHADTKDRYEQAKQEIEQLRVQVERLSNCQQPREFTLYPPSMIPLGGAVLRQLTSDSGSTSSAADWDYDRLLTKWKGVVLGSRRPTTIAETVFPPTPMEGVAAAEFSTPNYTPSKGFTAMNTPSAGVGRPNGPTHLADAPGEDVSDAARDDEQPATHATSTPSVKRVDRPRGPAGSAPHAVAPSVAAQQKGANKAQAARQTPKQPRQSEGQVELDVSAEGFLGGRMLMGLSGGSGNGSAKDAGGVGSKAEAVAVTTS